jgi:tetratricopeptide (TPR) repeat protein
MLGSGRRSTALGGVLFVALLVYCNTLLNGFVYDDHHQVEGNPYVQSFKYVGKIFTGTVWSFQGLEGQTNYYRPLMTFGFLICNKVFQAFPSGFHVVNVLLNCVVVWLVFLTCSMLFRDDTVALAAAVLFALHPIHTEVVNWIAAVTELELAVFYLAAFILFLRLGSVPAKQKIPTQIWMCACFALALLSKEQAVTLAIIATIYEHFYRSDRETTTWQTKAFRYGGFWVMAAMYLVFRVTVLGGLAPVRQHADVSWPEAVLSAFALAGQYAAKLFWPYPSLAFYVFRKSTALTDPRVLAGIGVGVFAVLLFIYLWKRARNYSFAVLWIAVTLAPVLNARWMATNVFTERYLYLPSVGFCALVAGGFVFLFRRFTGRIVLLRSISAATIILLSFAAGEIVARNRDWHDDFTLLSRTLAIEPHASYMRSDLGVLEWSTHRREEAESQWRLALIDKPDNAVALSNLGLVMLEKKRYDDAKNYLRQVIELRPRFAAPHIHLGRLYIAEGQPSAAESEFRRAVEIYPLSVEARNALGKFYFDQGKLPDAEAQFRGSLEALPNAEAWNRLGDIYERQGLHAKAEESWRKVVDLDPFDAHAHESLGSAYLASGRRAEAAKEYRAVLVLDPRNEVARKAMLELSPEEYPSAYPSKGLSPQSERRQ